ncbi:hypothetical protein ABT010_26420 [Streptomyces sp. NPDC002668]|uniref:hypothetical protein n=1 Tax=Streptomyces sp. NPDC002668 TaxID=3154422 RepID=UPI00332252F7
MMASQGTEPALPAQHRDLWSGIAGLVAGALLIAGQALWMGTPDTRGSGALRRVFFYYIDDSNQGLSEATALVLLVSGLLFLFFVVALARLAGNRSHLVLVGGTAFTALLMVGAVAGNIFGITANHSAAFPVLPETALLAFLLLNVAYGAMIAAMAGAAVMLFALWRAGQQTRTIPAWLGWAGFVVAVVSLAGPLTAWLTPLLLGVWSLGGGVVLIMNARLERAAETPADGPPPEGTGPTDAAGAGPAGTAGTGPADKAGTGPADTAGTGPTGTTGTGPTGTADTGPSDKGS